MHMYKSFDDFKKLVSDNADDIHKSIVQRVSDYQRSIPQDDMRSENHMRAWSEICVMEMLERYHKWLSEPER